MSSGVDRLVLDTSAYIHLRRGDQRVVEHMAAAASVVVPVIVLAELEALFRRGQRLSENLRLLEELVAEPFVVVAEVRRATAHRYALAHAALRRAGTPIPTNDVWIAAVTFEVGGTLLTFDADFAQVEGLLVERLLPIPPASG